jgi:glutaminase
VVSKEDLADVAYAVMEESRAVAGGVVASYIPELAAVSPDQLGVAICGVDGWEWSLGDAAIPFTLQSAANPFAYATALDAAGFDHVHGVVGMEPSGNPFNAIVFEAASNKPYNPLVNAGAIAVASLIRGKNATERLQAVLGSLNAFAGGSKGSPGVQIDTRVLLSEKAAGERNRAIACLLRNFDLIEDEDIALDLYFQQCSAVVTCQQLARMGATLANGGVNPITNAQAVTAENTQHVLTMMYMCGLNNGTGEFVYEAGIPAKSGISGAIVAAVPGRFGIAVWSPRVDANGNSVRGMAFLSQLSQRLGLNQECGRRFRFCGQYKH